MATSESKKRDQGRERAERAGEREKPRRKRFEPEVEPTPVISGRYLVAAILLGGATLVPSCNFLGGLLEPPEPQGSDLPNWVPGKTGTIRLTVVTADEASLTCASTESFEGKHCAFKSETEAWPRDPKLPLDDNKTNVIQPYRTWFDNQLILVSDVWAQPELAYRVHREPAAGMMPDKLARFVTECKVRFVGRMEKPDLRWQPQQNWGVEKPTVVAAATECHVVDEPSGECPVGPVCALFR